MDIYSGHSTILSKLKNREQFEGLEKRKRKGGKRRKKKRVIKHTLKGVFDFRSFLALFRLPAKCPKNHPIFLKFLQ